MVSLPPLIAAKLALYEARREVTVRRLLDLDYRSQIGDLEKALALLGKQLVVEVHDAA